MNYLNKVLILVMLMVTVLAAPKLTFGQYYSQEGGKKTIVIDKKVGWEKGKYFDNLGQSKQLFGADQAIYFQIIVENTGNNDLSNLNVSDLLPSNLKLTYNPGKYSPNDNKLNWTISQLGIGQTKVFEIAAKVGGEDKLVQKTNYVEVSGGGVFDSDSSRYWVGAKTMPKTGPGDVIALTAIFGGMGGSGLVLRKLIRGY